jgi:hypothetical protein
MSQTTLASQTVAPFEGCVVDVVPGGMATATSAEASSEIPFGVCVQNGASDDLALLLAGAAALDLIGIAAHSHAHAKDTELGTTGLKPKTTFNLLRKGRIYVFSEEAVTPADTVRVRHTAGAGGTVLGRFRKAAVAGETFDISLFARWVKSGSAGGLAILEVDFTSAGHASADT